MIRIQNIVLSKVQDKSGKPIKFFTTAGDTVNIVVVDATDSILSTMDIHDCLLATHGDPEVEEVYRRDLFGTFQQDKAEYPQRIHDLAVKYRHVRETLHCVLFLFKERRPGILAYRLEQFRIWNPVLIDAACATSILADVIAAIPVRRESQS